MWLGGTRRAPEPGRRQVNTGGATWLDMWLMGLMLDHLGERGSIGAQAITDGTGRNARILYARWSILFSIWMTVLPISSLAWLGISLALQALGIVKPGFTYHGLLFIQGFVLVAVLDCAWRTLLAWKHRQRGPLENGRQSSLAFVELKDYRLVFQVAGAVLLAIHGW
jgi:hypothetical protein